MRHLRRYSTHQLVLASALVLSFATLGWLFGVRVEPSALLLRSYYEKFAAATAIETDHFGPSIAIRERGEQQYGSSGDETSFDVYRPVNAKNRRLPTIIWLHGGGWIGGSKTDVEPYVKKLASGQFTVIAMNYPLAPAATYPTAVQAVNEGVKYVIDHAGVYGVDQHNIVLAGNNAGANLAAQLAAISTNPQYAKAVGITPALRAQQLKGVVLSGGIYDVPATTQLSGLSACITRLELQAYTGARNTAVSASAELMSPVTGISAAFPPTWITAGDADPLTETQAIPFAEALVDLGVPVSTLFHDPGTTMPSDYVLMLALPQAKRAFASMIDFVHNVTE